MISTCCMSSEFALEIGKVGVHEECERGSCLLFKIDTLGALNFNYELKNSIRRELEAEGLSFPID